MKAKVTTMLVLIIGGIIGLGSIQYLKAKNESMAMPSQSKHSTKLGPSPYLTHRQALHGIKHRYFYANYPTAPQPIMIPQDLSEQQRPTHIIHGPHYMARHEAQELAGHPVRVHRGIYAAEWNHKHFGHVFRHKFPDFWPLFFYLDAWVDNPYWPYGWSGYTSFANDTPQLMQMYYGSTLMATLQPGQNIFLVQPDGPFTAVTEDGESITYQSNAPFILISQASGYLTVSKYGYNYYW